MKAAELMRARLPYSEIAFAELVLWRLPSPLLGSAHSYKYRLAFVVNGACVLRYDNEAGKGDHRHIADVEYGYRFTTPERLIADFQRDIQIYLARSQDENRHP